MNKSFTYTFKGDSHADTSAEYFASLNMNTEQIESVLQQKEFEEEQVVRAERKWRNTELARADTELNKIQDGAAGNPVDWAEYRNKLRDLPSHIDFPADTARPASPT